jgi:hypothetical protein
LIHIVNVETEVDPARNGDMDINRYVASMQGTVQKVVMILNDRGKYFFVLKALKNLTNLFVEVLNRHHA